jgi:predicted nucleic-acid-binding protein
MRAVDTNVLVRLITRDDATQVASAERFVAKGAWISHVVIVETVWVLISVYELDDAAIATALEMLLNHRDFTIQDGDVVAAALDNYRERPALGFSDCLILEIAKKAGHTPLGTFDKRLGRREGAHRLTP